MIGDAEVELVDGILTLRIDLRPGSVPAGADRVIPRSSSGCRSSPIAGRPGRLVPLAHVDHLADDQHVARRRAPRSGPTRRAWRTSHDQPRRARTARHGRPPVTSCTGSPAIDDRPRRRRRAPSRVPASRTGGRRPRASFGQDAHREGAALLDELAGHRVRLDGDRNQLRRGRHLHDPVGRHQVAPVAGRGCPRRTRPVGIDQSTRRRSRSYSSGSRPVGDRADAGTRGDGTLSSRTGRQVADRCGGGGGRACAR